MTDLEYVKPETLDEALEFLRDHGRDTRPVAGGTDVLVDIRYGKLRAQYLMDISRLTELKGIALEEEGLSVGAGATISEINSSPLIRRFAPALQKASSTFGSKQIRNTATIGGNVGNASPSADTVPPMIVHEALAVLRDINGQRTLPIEKLFAGPYKSAIHPEELILRFILKPAKGLYNEFQKIGRRKALAIARINMAVLAEKDGEGTFSFIRLALGSSTPTPRRMKEVEDFLMGKRPGLPLLIEGGLKMAEKMIEVSGRRPSTVYKEKAVQGLFVKMLYPMVEHERRS